MTNEQKKHLHLVLTNGGLAAVATIKPSAGPRVWQIELDPLRSLKFHNHREGPY